MEDASYLTTQIKNLKEQLKFITQEQEEKNGEKAEISDTFSFVDHKLHTEHRDNYIFKMMRNIMIKLNNHMEQIDSHQDVGVKIGSDIQQLIDQAVLERDKSQGDSLQLNKYLADLKDNFQPKQEPKKYIIQHKIERAGTMQLTFNKTVQTDISVNKNALPAEVA